jgi:DNA-binding GntR family transcriptional regulator
VATRSRDNTAEIHRQLRQAILRGELTAGSELSQVKLADDFGVSRGPVREALRLLEREGLVEEELYALRIVTEAFAIRATVPHLTGDELAMLHTHLDEMNALAGTDVGLWETVHRRFHHTLVSYSGARIVRLIAQLYDHAERYRLVYHAQGPRAWSQGDAEHREIVAACDERDSPEAAAALARHLARTASSVLMQVAPDHEPSLVRDAVRAASSTEPASRPLRVAQQHM